MIDSTKAKEIVSRDLIEWRGTRTELNQGLKRLASTSLFKSVAQREKLIEKNKRKYLSNIYCKKVSAKYSDKVAFISSGEQVNTIQNDRFKKHLATSEFDFHIFIVKDDIQKSGGLHIVMFNIRNKNKASLSHFYTVAIIKRHCLERLVERMGLSNIREALSELLPAIDLFDASGFELAVRGKKNIGTNFKRHIPTENGACLLQSTSKIDEHGVPVQDCNLITWIHKKQFFEAQEVSNKRLNFVLTINSYLSFSDFESVLAKWKDSVIKLKDTSLDESMLFVVINGWRYGLDEFMNALENKKYLDFEIDFERYK